MKKIFFLILTAFVTSVASAQYVDADALSVLNKTSDKIKKTTGIKGTFDLTMNNAQISQKQTYTGSFALKGDKFKLSLNNVDTYFNGQTQWVYMKENKEVTISTPTVDELKEVNPLLLLTSYKTGYQIKKEEDTTYSGKAVYDLKLYPEDKNAPYFQIRILIEKTTLNPLLVEARSRNGVTTSVKLKQYQENQNLSSSTFVFTPAADDEVIDLR